MEKTRPKRGAPSGNRNALRHGRYSGERLMLLAEIRAHIKKGKALARSIHSNLSELDRTVPAFANASETEEHSN